MLFLMITCMIAAAVAAPSYDQRQEGDFNVRADVQNVVLLILRPEKISSGVFDLFSKNVKPHHHNNEDAQERSDIHTMEAFVEPNEPYRVEINSEGERYPDADGRGVEIVIAGKRRLDTEAQPEKDEYKLIGAIEQCGPERVRNPVTLMCQFPEKKLNDEPEAVPATP